VTSLGFVEYFDSIKLAIAKMLTQYDTAERSSTECAHTLEVIKAAGILRVTRQIQTKLEVVTR